MKGIIEENMQDEDNCDAQISTVLIGEFDDGWLKFLQWKNTYPISDCVKFMHIHDREKSCIYDVGINYSHNPLPEFIHENISKSLMAIMVVGKAGSISFSELLDLAVLVKSLTPITILYISNSNLSVQQIQQLESKINCLILSQQEHYVNCSELMPEKIQRQIHRNNDIAIIAVIEALATSIFRPDLAVISMDFSDIKQVIADNARGMIASAVEDGYLNDNSVSRAERVARKTINNPMLLNSISNVKSMYAIIFFGENEIGLSELYEIGAVIEEYTREETMVVMGMHYSKYLGKDEVQLVIIATDKQDLLISPSDKM